MKSKIKTFKDSLNNKAYIEQISNRLFTNMIEGREEIINDIVSKYKKFHHINKGILSLEFLPDGSEILKFNEVNLIQFYKIEIERNKDVLKAAQLYKIFPLTNI